MCACVWRACLRVCVWFRKPAEFTCRPERLNGRMNISVQKQITKKWFSRDGTSASLKSRLFICWQSHDETIFYHVTSTAAAKKRSPSKGNLSPKSSAATGGGLMKAGPTSSTWIFSSVCVCCVSACDRTQRRTQRHTQAKHVTAAAAAPRALDNSGEPSWNSTGVALHLL